MAVELVKSARAISLVKSQRKVTHVPNVVEGGQKILFSMIGIEVGVELSDLGLIIKDMGVEVGVEPTNHPLS